MNSISSNTSMRLGIFLALLLASGYSCKKKVESLPNDNEIKATIRFKSGRQIDINVTGTKAQMGCGSFAGGRYVVANDEINGQLSLSAFQCLDSVGTYNNVYVRYTPNTNSQLSPLYENSVIPISPGGPTSLSIFTIKTLKVDYIEGAFSSMAWYQNDTILITGTFKGDYLQ